MTPKQLTKKEVALIRKYAKLTNFDTALVRKVYERGNTKERLKDRGLMQETIDAILEHKNGKEV